jgi:hypothetical protein
MKKEVVAGFSLRTKRKKRNLKVAATTTTKCLNLNCHIIMTNSIPKSLLSFFSDYSKLNLRKDKNIIIPRVLDFGTINELRWLFRTYPKTTIKNFLKTRGFRSLSARAFNFYCHLFGIRNYNRPKFAKNKYLFWKY